MSFDNYRNGIMILAQNEAAGEDIDTGIANLARAAKTTAELVRHEVTEALELID